MNKNASEMNTGDDLPEATGKNTDEAGLGGRVTACVLIVATSSVSDFAQSFHNVLKEANYRVSTASPTQWEQAVGVLRPSVVLVEATASIEEAISICRALKSSEESRLVLAVLPETPSTENREHWYALKEAGADDFIPANLCSDALEARVLLLARLAAALRENQDAEERLARHMQIDEATQLLNRRFFFQSAQRECSRARRYGHTLSCLMVDIEYLDDVTRTFGYGCAEYVLRAVAYAVRQWTRDSDVAGRFNERKFAVLLPETDVEGAVAVREKILGAITESKYSWEGRELPISVSIGEAERRYERPSFESSTPAAEGEAGEETPSEEFGSEPLSVREELASLLEDADAALNVARRSSMRPGIFVQYTPTE
jgi:diguanylate cyclase (GGDEF)-like protein